MPDSVRSFADLLVLLANRRFASVDPQNLRDFLLSTYRDYIKVSDVKAANTAGGGFTNGAWRRRDINTEDSDVGGHAAIAGNQITLQAGDYFCAISAPASKVGRHKARLQNITDAATTLIGSSEWSESIVGPGAVTRSVIVGTFAIAVPTVFEIQHQCETTLAASGFGVESNFGVSEVYTVAEFWWRAA